MKIEAFKLSHVYLGMSMYNNIAITSKIKITYLSVRPKPCIHGRINRNCMFKVEIISYILCLTRSPF